MREGGHLVSQVHQLSGRVFSRVLKQRGIGDINPAQGRILYALWKRGEIPQGDLAALTRLDKSTLALMLDRLEKASLVERIGDPDDSRKKSVRASEKARLLYESYGEASAAMIDIFYRGLETDEIDRFEATLRKILSNLEGELP